MKTFRAFEEQVIRSLTSSVLDTGIIDQVLSNADFVSLEHTGVGYFLTVKHVEIPEDHDVCDTPAIAGTAGEVSLGFVVFLEDGELTLECHSWGIGEIPADIRDREVTLHSPELLNTKPTMLTGFQDKTASTGIGCAFFFVLSLALFGWWYSESPFDNQKFSAAEWATAWEEDRGHMTMDLIENYLPIGILEAEVVALLGRPGEEVRLQGELRRKAFVYGIGSWGFGVHGDDSYLSIYFDESGKLISAEIWGV